MKPIRTIACILTVFTLSSCHFLEFSESTGKSEDYMYSYMSKTVTLVNELYSHLKDDQGTIGNSMRESATDNLCMIRPDDPVNDYFNGSWSQINALDGVWAEYYGAIRSANSFLENFDLSRYDRFFLDPSYEETIKEMSLLPFEARFLRAYFYFELVKRYYNIPLILDVVSTEDVNHLQPATPEQVFAFIETECDEIADQLPPDYRSFISRESGRATKGSVLALKSRSMLYAASPLFNPTQDVEKYKKAAKASMDLITYAEGGKYKITPGEKLYGIANDMLLSKQLIFECRHGSSATLESTNSPIAYEGVSLGKANCPTQNLVECFDKKDGTPFPAWAVGEERKNPFENMDPRFAETVMYDGVNWMEQKVEIFEGGMNGQDKEYSSRTGYYLMKHLHPGTCLIAGRKKTFQHHSYIFRYAEALLSYAEAMNEAYGADYTDGTFTKSATDAVNEVRTRSKMPALSSGMSKEDFRKALQKERRVELAVEDHYFWDIRRWKIYGDDPVEIPIYGVKVKKNEAGEVVYTKYLVETRHWDPKMYLYPIPLSELKLNSNIKQNPGW